MSTGLHSPEALTTPTLPAPRRRIAETLRRRRFWLIVAGIFLLVTLGIFLAGQGQAGDRGTLSPGNPAPDGAMAAAEILKDHGVAVKPSDSLQRTLDIVKNEGAANVTVLLFDDAALLRSAQVQSLRRSGARLVMVSPGFQALSGAGGGITAAGVASKDATSVRPECPLAEPAGAGEVSAGAGLLYRGPVVCFPDAVASGRARPAGSYAATADGLLVVLGNQDLLTNKHLDQRGNAALAFRTLGARPTLVWYRPSLQDIEATPRPKSLSELTPAWVTPLGAWLLLVGLVAMLWKGRRVGPLVSEPLPVMVKAAETAEGRARLYQTARSTELAAAGLRAGTLVRLARHFRLGADASAQTVADAVARHVTRPQPDVFRILVDEQPATDTELLRWAQLLEELEKEATTR